MHISSCKGITPKYQSGHIRKSRDETSRDICRLQLIDMAEHGFPKSRQLMPPQLLPYWRFRENLSIVDGVLMYGSRAVIPPKLQGEVIEHIHGTHQGISQMSNRASNCVFWPGITSDIQAARAQCTSCDVNAPSQRKTPSVEPFVSVEPFQAIASDFFKLQGKHYLLSVDRFSNWPDVREAFVHSDDSEANGLIKACLDFLPPLECQRNSLVMGVLNMHLICFSHF